MAIDRDELTGEPTTGHEWDGVKEFDRAIPKPAIWAYGVSITVAITGWLLYPSIPLGSDYFRGLIGTTSRERVIDAVDAAKMAAIGRDQVILDRDLTDLVSDPEIRAEFFAPTAVLFQDNCAACHGANLMGQRNFPNLVDAAWLFSGDIDDIETTIRHGINAQDDETRFNQMPAFGRDQMLPQTDIDAAAEFVLKVSGQEHDPALATIGATVFSENCSGCHGDDAMGIGIGAPNLTDEFWIYGGDRASILNTLANGRAGHMPNWQGRLSGADIRKLALCVKWQGIDAGHP